MWTAEVWKFLRNEWEEVNREWDLLRKTAARVHQLEPRSQIWTEFEVYGDLFVFKLQGWSTSEFTAVVVMTEINLRNNLYSRKKKIEFHWRITASFWLTVSLQWFKVNVRKPVHLHLKKWLWSEHNKWEFRCEAAPTTVVDICQQRPITPVRTENIDGGKRTSVSECHYHNDSHYLDIWHTLRRVLMFLWQSFQQLCEEPSLDRPHLLTPRRGAGE